MATYLCKSTKEVGADWSVSKAFLFFGGEHACRMRFKTLLAAEDISC